MKLKRASLVSQGSLARMLQEATESWKRCDFQKALETMERIRRLDPANATLLIDLGGLYGKRYDFDGADRCFEQAVRVASKKANALALAAQKCRDFRREDLAEQYLRRALEHSDASPEILIQLAELYERRRQTADAIELVERALSSNSVFGPALLLRARLNRQTGQLADAEQLLKNFPAGLAPKIRASSLYELGSVLDRQGRYDEAMSAFLEAKALLRPLAEQPAAELKIMRARIEHMTANASADLLHQWYDTASTFQPNRRLALLGGHPRSGTTLLEQVLDAHSDIVSAEETEILQNEAYGPLLRGHPDETAMFASLASAGPPQLQQARENYFKAMELSLGHPIAGRLLIDKNPSYTFLIPALVRIFPEIRFLIALRDPRDVVLSCFMQDIPMNQVGAAYLSLSSATEEYAALMNVWQTLKVRLRNPYLEIRYEDMVENLETVARKTLDFLGAPWDDRVLGFDEHARKKMVRSPTYADVTQPVYKRAVGRWQHYRKYLEPHLPKLDPLLKAFGYE